MKKIVLFLHGYGSNGNDLISLKDYISLEKEETEFISPNACLLYTSPSPRDPE